MDGNVNDNYIVSSLVRGFKILSTFTVKKPSLKVTEIADITGLDQATVFRFVYTLEKLGYLVRDEETKRYRQSIRMRTLTLPASHGIAVRDAAIPVIENLTAQLNEATKLGILDGPDVIIVGFSDVFGKLIHHTPIGTRLPAYCSALGKVMLANQPPAILEMIIEKIDFNQPASRTITTPEDLKKELAVVRQLGYAIQDGELIAGLGSIAAPVYDHDQKVIAAISISGLATNILHGGETDNYISELLTGAQIISNQLVS